MEWREANGVRMLEASLPGATAVFTTRIGGISEPPFDGLNLGVLTDDRTEAVVDNRRRLATALEIPPERIVFSRQVHGADLVEHPTPQPCSFAADTEAKARRKQVRAPQTPFRCSFVADSAVKEQRNGVAPVEADGHVVSEAGIAALVFVADCVPVALVGPGGVAMLHCGWRGLAAGLIARGAEAVGATDAAIGPSIGPCCYDVGEEVLRELAAKEDEQAERMLNLPAIAARQLREAGVERVEASGLCTSCEAELFFSHRRDAGRTGRQAGLVWLNGEGG